MVDAFDIMYPERRFSGFSRGNITVLFYNLVGSLTSPDSVVVDLGAGRGAQIEEAKTPYLKQMLTLQGRCAKLIGCDVDSAVLDNPYLDEAYVFDPAKPLPLETASVDLIYSDWVLEHVENPEFLAAEVHRVLKPGGWFCARTPNKWGMISLAKAIIPESLHASVLARLQPTRKEVDIFPTHYRMNTKGKIREYFPESLWNNHSFVDGNDPGYFNRSLFLARLSHFYNAVVPSPLGLILFVFVQKRTPGEI